MDWGHAGRILQNSGSGKKDLKDVKDEKDLKDTQGRFVLYVL